MLVEKLYIYSYGKSYSKIQIKVETWKVWSIISSNAHISAASGNTRIQHCDSYVSCHDANTRRLSAVAIYID